MRVTFSFPAQIGLFNGGHDVTLLGGVRYHFDVNSFGDMFIGVDGGGLNYPGWDYALLPYIGTRRNLFKWMFIDLDGGYETVRELVIIRGGLGIKL